MSDQNVLVWSVPCTDMRGLPRRIRITFHGDGLVLHLPASARHLRLNPMQFGRFRTIASDIAQALVHEQDLATPEDVLLPHQRMSWWRRLRCPGCAQACRVCDITSRPEKRWGMFYIFEGHASSVHVTDLDIEVAVTPQIVDAGFIEQPLDTPAIPPNTMVFRSIDLAIGDGISVWRLVMPIPIAREVYKQMGTRLLEVDRHNGGGRRGFRRRR